MIISASSLKYSLVTNRKFLGVEHAEVLINTYRYLQAFIVVEEIKQVLLLMKYSSW